MAPYRRRTGFTLIEIVVALVIMTVSLAALMQLFQTGMAGSSAAENRIYATLHAQSRLAALGVETTLEVGETDGDFDDRFRWSTLVAPIESADGMAPGALRRAPTATAYQVTVSVLWGPLDEAQSVSLTSIDLALEAAADR